MKADSMPAFALEKEALKTEIEAGIQTGVEQMESGQKGKKPVEKYHNTRHLLRQYRKVAYAVEISETDMNVRMEMEHGTRLSTLKVNAELAGVDLSGSKIESYRRIWISESAGSDRSRRCSPFSHFVSWTRNSLRPVKETCSHHLQQAAIHSHRLR